ncbi:MAG: hypothetical protein ACLT8E_11085 [Akkermansia sp.]
MTGTMEGLRGVRRRRLDLGRLENGILAAARKCRPQSRPALHGGMPENGVPVHSTETAETWRRE